MEKNKTKPTVDDLLSRISDDLYAISNEEQNELILKLIDGIQTKRRKDMEVLMEQKETIDKEYNSLKESICKSVNLSKT